MHLHVAKSLASDQREADLASCMTEITCAVGLIAAYLNRAAVAYEEHAAVFVRNRPEILATLFNLGGSGPKGDGEFVPDAKRLAAHPDPDRPPAGRDIAGSDANGAPAVRSQP